jgi:CheY-like chemotaxis protein
VILLIEDDVVSQHIITALLNRLRFPYRVARDLAGAHAALALGAVDLVVVDLAVPDAEGLAMLASLRAHPALHEVPVLFCTAFTDGAAIERALASGTVDLVRKPIDVDLLASAVDRALRYAPVR